MKPSQNLIICIIPFTLIFSSMLLSCAGENGDMQARADTDPYLEQFKEMLTPFELEHGIGPITERMSIDDEIDEELSMRGQSFFEMKCEVCHDLDQRKVGPALGDVVERRSPEFVMNFILNPGENVLNHPVGLDLLAEHHTEMPFANVTEEEARAIYEFLRDYYDKR
jgi:hypothetical protein